MNNTPGWITDRNGREVFGVETTASALGEWETATVAQVRDVILTWHIAGPDWRYLALRPEADQFTTTEAEVEVISDLAHAAVTAGRLIEFGLLPNEVMKQCADRAGPMWNVGALGMPFMAPWLLFHTWEQGAAVYLVNPHRDSFEVCELQPATVHGERLLCIADRGSFDRVEGMLPQKRYHCSIAPASIRFVADPEIYQRMNNGGTPQTAAAGNIGDPVMTALLILNTRNIERETIAVAAKLNKARAKSGKPPIPPYDRVHTQPYVTAILGSGQRRSAGPGTGSHASPQFHIRRGHPRHYSAERWKGAAGKSIFIPDTLVNATEEQRAAFKTNRSHYRVRP